MSLRRPAIDSPLWLYQDKVEFEDGTTQHRVLEVKYDGSPWSRVSETYDYSNPPFPNELQRGGPVVASIYYNLNGKLVTIDDWATTWRDDWALRLGVNYLLRCRYRPSLEYMVRVAKENYPFWVSEELLPYDNKPNSYLIR